MPDGIVYAIKDSQARKDIEDIKKNGSAGGSSDSGGLFVISGSNIPEETGQIMLDKTVGEIIEAMKSKSVVCIFGEDMFCNSINIMKMAVGGEDKFVISINGEMLVGQTESINDYPIVSMSV